VIMAEYRSVRTGPASRKRSLAGKHERYSKARLSGFGPAVELAAGGRSAEARKGIALGPGDRNAKSGGQHDQREDRRT
jgi:hypothetical protein